MIDASVLLHKSTQILQMSQNVTKMQQNDASGEDFSIFNFKNPIISHHCALPINTYSPVQLMHLKN